MNASLPGCGDAAQPHGEASRPAALTLAQTLNISANLSEALWRHVVVKRKKNVYFSSPSPKDLTSDFLARRQADFRWWRHLRRPAALAEFTAHSLICPKATNSGFLPPSFTLWTRSTFLFPFAGNKECCNWTTHFKDTKSAQMNEGHFASTLLLSGKEKSMRRLNTREDKAWHCLPQ